MKLIYTETRQEVRVGDTAETFRGEQCVVTSIEEPRHSGSTGRVYLTIGECKSHGYFPSVIGAVWSDF